MNEFECFNKYLVLKDHKEIADEVLMDVVDEAATLNAPVCLMYGVCLGFVRDGGYVPYDNDIDIHVYTTVNEWKRLMCSLKKRGFVIPDNNDGAHIIKNKIMVDISRLDEPSPQFDVVTYNGIQFNVPHPVEAYLESVYGDWQKPHWIEPHPDKYAIYRRYKERIEKNRRRRKEIWNNIAAEWERRKGQLEEELDSFQVEERLDFLFCLKHRAKILDLGCGRCRDLLFFRSFGLSCVGLDFSGEMIKGSKDVILGSALKLPLSKESFDGVWCNSVLKHLSRSDLFSCLREVKRVLKNGGIFWVDIDEGTGEVVENYENGEVVFSLYSVEEFEFMIEKIGFKVLSVKKIEAWRKFVNFLLEKVA